MHQSRSHAPTSRSQEKSPKICYSLVVDPEYGVDDRRVADLASTLLEEGKKGRQGPVYETLYAEKLDQASANCRMAVQAASDSRARIVSTDQNLTYWLDLAFGTREVNVQTLMALCALESPTDDVKWHSLLQTLDPTDNDVAKMLDPSRRMGYAPIPVWNKSTEHDLTDPPSAAQLVNKRKPSSELEPGSGR